MTIDQLSIFVENKTGGLAEVTRTMVEHGIDMRTLSIAEMPDFGVLRAIVSEPERTASILLEAGYICKVTPVLAVAIEDRPGGLNKVLEILQEHDINLEYTYAFVTRKSATAYMVLRVADNNKAIEVLRENDIPLLSSEDLLTL